MFGKAEAKSYELFGKVLKCQFCGHDQFHQRDAQLNTAVMSFMNLDWMNTSAICYVCDQCGYIHWFHPK